MLQLSPYLEKKAFIPIYNIHSYLQRSQIYNHFLKAFFFCRWWWFFQIRMSRSIKMRRKKRQLICEDFLLETATGNRENRILEESLLGTTFCSSCAVHPNSVCPITALYTRLFTDPFEFNASNTWHEERRKRRLFWCLLSCEPCQESGRGSTDRGLQSACWIFNNSEAHPLNPSHAVNCSNSSDTRAPGMRFSSVWFLTETDCT